MQCKCAILSSVACHALQYFFILFHKRHDFRKKNLLNTKCVVWFTLQLPSETFLIRRTIEWSLFKSVYWSPCRVPIILVWFKWNLNFLDSCSKNTQTSHFTEIHSVGTKLFNADRRKDGRTDAMKLIVAFRNFANAPKNLIVIECWNMFVFRTVLCTVCDAAQH
jgi:hypothetical protein